MHPSVELAQQRELWPHPLELVLRHEGNAMLFRSHSHHAGAYLLCMGGGPEALPAAIFCSRYSSVGFAIRANPIQFTVKIAMSTRQFAKSRFRLSRENSRPPPTQLFVRGTGMTPGRAVWRPPQARQNRRLAAAHANVHSPEGAAIRRFTAS